MKKIYVRLSVVLAISMLLFSCSQEFQESSEANSQRVTNKDWKTAPITQEIVNNQQQISHYAFEVNVLKALVENAAVNYVWFDLGLNSKNQITFTATGENTNKEIVGQVTSTIVTTKEYQANFSIFNTVEEVSFGDKFNHILKNKEAYQYLTNMQKAYKNFEITLDQEGQRVERFGYDPMVVKRILMTQDIHTLGLFLGQNKKQKMTTVFIGIDANNNLLINNSTNISTAGKAFDFTTPCPNECDGPVKICAQYCDSPWWMCCKYK